MKLSDAIALGRTLVQPNTGWYTLSGGKGCACGMALVAAGYPHKNACEIDVQRYWWPWVTPVLWCEISSMYIEVARGKKTLDQLIDQVRQWEPAEQPESQLPSAVGAQPDSSVDSIGATDEQLEQMRENEYDSRANTR